MTKKDVWPVPSDMRMHACDRGCNGPGVPDPFVGQVTKGDTFDPPDLTRTECFESEHTQTDIIIKICHGAKRAHCCGWQLTWSFCLSLFCFAAGLHLISGCWERKQPCLSAKIACSDRHRECVWTNGRTSVQMGVKLTSGWWDKLDGDSITTTQCRSHQPQTSRQWSSTD